MYLTYIGAAERPHTEVRAGAERNPWRDARDGMPAVRGATVKASISPGLAILGGSLAGAKTR